MRRTAEAYFAAGAREVSTGNLPGVRLRSPAEVLRIWEAGVGAGEVALFTFHQMGSARMGGRRDRDVCDPTGRMWAWPNLYVADASLFPTASGVNPQITVYALADLVADGLLAVLR